MKAASTPFKKKKKQSGVWLTLMPLYLFTLVFVAGPLVYMFVLSFQTRAEVWGVVLPRSIMGLTMETTMQTAATIKARETTVLMIFAGVGPLE